MHRRGGRRCAAGPAWRSCSRDGGVRRRSGHADPRGGAAGGEALARDIAAPRPGLIDARGRYPDYVQATDPQYPPPMLGYALIQTGLRTGTARRSETGLRTLNHSVVDIHPRSVSGCSSPCARSRGLQPRPLERLPEDPLFARHRAAWERWLRRVPLGGCPTPSTTRTSTMVEAVAVFGLRRSGLTSDVKGSALASGEPQRAPCPAAGQRGGATRGRRTLAPSSPGGAAFVLSDPSNNALAYHALTFGFFARAVELLGPGASPQARHALQGVARASRGLQDRTGTCPTSGGRRAWRGRSASRPTGRSGGGLRRRLGAALPRRCRSGYPSPGYPLRQRAVRPVDHAVARRRIGCCRPRPRQVRERAGLHGA